MAFDIFGNNIKPGYCEAHPWICEEYPCCECIEEQQAARYPREMMAQMEEDYYAGQMHREHEAELEKLNKYEDIQDDNILKEEE